jgi:hypothetical protein
MCLVEIIDVENQLTLRGIEQSEVAQVCIAAQLSVDPGVGPARQVIGHDQRAPPVERKRRPDHPPVPNRHQFRHPGRSLTLQEFDGIRAIVGDQIGVRLKRRCESCVLAGLCPSLSARVRHWPPRAARTGRGRLHVANVENFVAG